MPDPAEARFLGITEPYDDYRRWWMSTVVGLSVPKRRTSGRFKPEPGALPLSDTEEG